LKISGKCPKCGSSDLFSSLARQEASVVAGMTIFSSIRVTRFVCTACGFIEEWIEGEENLSRLHSKVRPAGANPPADDAPRPNYEQRPKDLP